MLFNVNTQILKYQYIYNIGVLKVNIELMWRGFRDPIHFSRRHPMTGASLGSSRSKPFSPRPLDTWDTRKTVKRAHAIRRHCWIGVLSFEVLIIYHGKINVALTFLCDFLFLKYTDFEVPIHIQYRCIKGKHRINVTRFQRPNLLLQRAPNDWCVAWQLYVQGKIIVALTYLFYFLFLNMHILKLHLYIVGIDYLINSTL
jgi:hypothetical protein